MVNKNIFDYEFYMFFYPDLLKNKINTFESAFRHYLNNGRKEGRYALISESSIFYANSWLLYKNNNPDLSTILKTDKDAFEHYMKYGKNEERKLYPTNVKNIKKFNWDLFNSKFYIDFY